MESAVNRLDHAFGNEITDWRVYHLEWRLCVSFLNLLVVGLMRRVPPLSGIYIYTVNWVTQKHERLIHL